jgi:hypothetical protein
MCWGERVSGDEVFVMLEDAETARQRWVEVAEAAGAMSTSATAAGVQDPQAEQGYPQSKSHQAVRQARVPRVWHRPSRLRLFLLGLLRALGQWYQRLGRQWSMSLSISLCVPPTNPPRP